MADRNGMWRFATGPGAPTRGLIGVALVCAALAGAGLTTPSPALPFLTGVPLAAALAGAAAGAVAIALSWPLLVLLRRRPGYYAAREETDA